MLLNDKIVKKIYQFIWQGYLLKIITKQLYLKVNSGGVNLIILRNKTYALFIKNILKTLNSSCCQGPFEILLFLMEGFLSDDHMVVPELFISYLSQIITHDKDIGIITMT